MDFDEDFYDYNDNNDVDNINCNVQLKNKKRNIVSHNNGK
jgi:hypothetical protein